MGSRGTTGPVKSTTSELIVAPNFTTRGESSPIRAGRGTLVSSADYQRDLSVAYERMGDLYSALG